MSNKALVKPRLHWANGSRVASRRDAPGRADYFSLCPSTQEASHTQRTRSEAPLSPGLPLDRALPHPYPPARPPPPPQLPSPRPGRGPGAPESGARTPSTPRVICSFLPLCG